MAELKAKNTVQDGKGTYAPGTVFSCDDPITIELLKAVGAAELVENTTATTAGPGTGKITAPPPNTQEMCKKIGECKTVEEIETLIKGETRKTVLEAADKKRERLSKAGA